MNKNEWKHLTLLIITAFIWGMAFVAQSLGANYIGPFTFLALRNWLGILVLLPLILHTKSRLHLDTEQKKQLLQGGLFCGIFLFLGSLFQQMGIAYTTTAKCGFITALYMLFVPILSIFTGKKTNLQIWIAVLIGLIGLYLLCIHGSFTNVNIGDGLSLIAALMFALQILFVNHYIRRCHPILLSGMQYLVCAVLGTLFMLTETISMENIHLALLPILYAGIFSTGVGYTLQIIGQKGLDPSIAALAMCLESVFSALGGWLILHQQLSPIELSGCALMFIAILFSQLSFKRKTTQ